MSFGGGSAGSTGVSNHVHDNNTGEGGSLAVPSTLIADMPLSTYVMVMG